jgi:hypothetical protein
MWKKYIVTFFSAIFFSTDATHTYDIILNTDTISCQLLDATIKQHNNMHLAFLFLFPFIWISNINIWCGQQNHERSTMETGRAAA